MTDPVPSKELAESLRRLAGWSMWTHPQEPDAERRADVRNLHAAYEDNLNKLEELHDAHDTLERDNDRLRTTLRGIQSCSTCEACRGAATLALGVAKSISTEEGLRRELTNALAQSDAYLRRLQAVIAERDALMLEHCPDETSAEQRAEWAKHQRPAHEREMPHCSTCACPPYQAPEPAAEPALGVRALPTETQLSRNFAMHSALMRLSHAMGNPAVQWGDDSTLEAALIDEATRRLAQPPVEAQWISAKVRLPEEGQRVLAHTAPASNPTMEASDGDPDVFVRIGSKWLNRNSFNYLGNYATVIYWMPCPEDPRDTETTEGGPQPRNIAVGMHALHKDTTGTYSTPLGVCEVCGKPRAEHKGEPESGLLCPTPEGGQTDEKGRPMTYWGGKP